MISGILYSCQFLVVSHRQPSIAEELMRESNYTMNQFLAEQKVTGYENAKMNAVIREAFRLKPDRKK